MNPLVLYQFPISHFSEKARWVLDHKGLRYRTQNLLPGLHAFVTRPLSGVASVPVLRDGGVAVGDSTGIALYLEAQRPDPPLLPRPGLDGLDEDSARARRDEVLALEDWFDRNAGPAARDFSYATLMQTPGAAGALFFSMYTGPVARLGPLLGKGFERGVRARYRFDAGTAERSRARLVEAVARIEERTEGDPNRYLVGARLSLADIAAAALLAPVLAPEESVWSGREPPEGLRALRDELRARPGGQWVLARYRFDRGARATA